MDERFDITSLLAADDLLTAHWVTEDALRRGLSLQELLAEMQRDLNGRLKFSPTPDEVNALHQLLHHARQQLIQPPGRSPWLVANARDLALHDCKRLDEALSARAPMICGLDLVRLDDLTAAGEDYFYRRGSSCSGGQKSAFRNVRDRIRKALHG